MTDRSKAGGRPSQACIYEVKPGTSRRRKSSSELTPHTAGMLRERNESGGTDTISCARTRLICTRYWGVGILDAPCLHKSLIYCITSPARIGVSENPTPCVGFSDSQREKFVVFAKPNGYSYGRSRSRSHS